jgi:hypothetical protein
VSDRIIMFTTPTNRRHLSDQVVRLPDGWRIEAKPAGRSLDQNSAQWPILEAFSKQLLWPVNGAMCRLTADEFKDVLTAAFKRETQPRLASGLDGGVVMLGRRTSKMGKKEFSDWLEFLHAVAALKGVDTNKR